MAIVSAYLPLFRHRHSHFTDTESCTNAANGKVIAETGDLLVKKRAI